MTDDLDGKVLTYTYPELGTVRVSLGGGRISFEWIAGALQGESGSDFLYHARDLGDERYFVNWHEPEAQGFVTLYVDLRAGIVHSSVLAGYRGDEPETWFHSASIDEVTT